MSITSPAFSQRLPSIKNRQRRIHECERKYALRIVQRELKGYPASHREAHCVHRLDSQALRSGSFYVQAVEEVTQVGGVVLESVAVRRDHAPAVAAHVVANDAKSRLL